VLYRLSVLLHSGFFRKDRKTGRDRDEGLLSNTVACLQEVAA